MEVATAWKHKLFELNISTKFWNWNFTLRSFKNIKNYNLPAILLTIYLMDRKKSSFM